MKKQPQQKKLSINKETIRRLTAVELDQIRGGDPGEQPPQTPDQYDGTFRECIPAG